MANKLIEENPAKQNFDLEGPGRLDYPLQAVRPPLPENQPAGQTSIPRARSPESLHGLQRNVGNSWVTSWATSTSKESTQIAHNQEESNKSPL
jgi:hypothetical protein